ncbi:hypothetical protein FRB90_009738 [Tulasnella sp. 427]|nr:hypothetical protein FRB90_009738 [Tulasnella sp. 427]
MTPVGIGATRTSSSKNARDGYLGLIKTIMLTAHFLQTDQSTTGSVDKIEQLITQIMPQNCPDFLLIPLAPPTHSYEERSRYLILWYSKCGENCVSAPQEITKDVGTNLRTTLKCRHINYAVETIHRRTRTKLIAAIVGHLSERAPITPNAVPYNIFLDAVRAGSAQLVTKGHLVADALKPDKVQSRVAGQGHRPLKRSLADDEKKEDEEDGGEDLVLAAKRRRTRPEPGPNNADTQGPTDSFEMRTLELVLNMISLRSLDGRVPRVYRAASGSPNRPTTSILRPFFMKEHPTTESNFWDPLEYKSNVGNPKIVHTIYREALQASRPRTKKEERARRWKAVRMAAIEVISVVDEHHWHRNGRRFFSGCKPLISVEAEVVPEAKQESWLKEKIDLLEQRRCEVEVTFEENEEVRHHIMAVYEAVLITRQAGANGIVF